MPVIAGRQPDGDAARCWRRSPATTRRPRRSLLALGYAGWDGGQLEREISANTWLTCDADESLIFGDDHATKWSRALAKIGVTPGQLSNISGEA